ncbi:MAG TPA: hypothetical protein VMF06_24510 [Candidatus Limnocylindria bacterium]|nr:hypothetical protein [Candidatus Limnocylindria bacterium]
MGWRRRLKRELISLLVVLALGFVVWAVEYARGYASWVTLRKDYAVREQYLDFDDWQRHHSEVRLDDQNFFGTPLLRPFFEFAITLDPTGLPDRYWSHPEQVFDALRLRLPAVTADRSRGGDGRMDLRFWHRVLVKTNNAENTPVEPAAAAEAVLGILGKWDAELRELDEASRRPDHRAPVYFAEENALPLGPQRFLEGVSQVIGLRAMARLELSQTEAAVQDIEFNERLGEILLATERPTARRAAWRIMGRSTRLVWEGLNRRRWDRVQLRRIERLLAAREFRVTWIKSLEAEQVQAREATERRIESVTRFGGRRNSGLSGMFQQEGRKLVTSFRQVVAGNNSPMDYAAVMADSSETIIRTCLLRLEILAIEYSPGWRYRNAVAEVREIERQMDYYRPWMRGEAYYDDIQGALPEFEADEWSVYHARQACNAMARLDDFRTVANAEYLSRMARIACGLEMFHLDAGGYPHGLDDLVPKYLADLPTNSLTGKPFGYNLEEGWYRLEAQSDSQDAERRGSRWPRFGGREGWGGAFFGDRP